MMRLGYNTNGLSDHEPLEALTLLSELGYRSVALTINHGCLNPYSRELPRQVESFRRCLERCGLRSVLETGARFLLDPRSKHEPTLVSADDADRARRVEFLCRAIDLASELGCDCVSLWSGVVRDGASREVAWSRLRAGLDKVVRHAEQRNVVIGFEPEPGMLIDTMAAYEELSRQFELPQFALTLDLGHLHCQGELPIADQVERYAARLVNVHIEDMRRGVHEHLMFGEGEMDFPPIMDALRRVGYEGGVHVELSRHSHDGPNAARRAYEFLSPLMRHDV
jgi:sugar phosphate isomerase/epimerase